MTGRRDALEREIAGLKRQLSELTLAAAELDALEPLLTEGELFTVVCRLLDVRIALPLAATEQAVPAAAMAPLPEAPSWVHGLLNLRGETIPVLDMAARIARGARELDIDDQIVICRHTAGRVGLVVQAVLGVQAFSLAGPDDAETAASVSQAPYVSATLRDAEGIVLLVNLGRLLATSEIPGIADPFAPEAPQDQGEHAQRPP